MDDLAILDRNGFDMVGRIALHGQNGAIEIDGWCGLSGRGPGGLLRDRRTHVQHSCSTGSSGAGLDEFATIDFACTHGLPWPPKL